MNLNYPDCYKYQGGRNNDRQRCPYSEAFLSYWTIIKKTDLDGETYPYESPLRFFQSYDIGKFKYNFDDQVLYRSYNQFRDILYDQWNSSRSIRCVKD